MIRYSRPDEPLAVVILSSLDGMIHGEYRPVPHDDGCVRVSFQASSYGPRYLPSFYGELEDGGYAIDERPWRARPDGVHLAICPPTLDPRLPDGERGRWGDVGLTAFLNYYRSNGARIGRRDGNAIRWEDGMIEPIAPASDRYLYRWESDDYTPRSAILFRTCHGCARGRAYGGCPVEPHADGPACPFALGYLSAAGDRAAPPYWDGAPVNHGPADETVPCPGWERHA